MVYPPDFESKIGFDRIRELTGDLCLGETGREKVRGGGFSTDHNLISLMLDQTAEFQHILVFDDEFPVDHFFDMQATLVKMRIEGAYPELSELFDLKRSLSAQKAVFNFVRNRNRDRGLYPRLEEITSKLSVFPFVFESIERILAKDGSMKDTASKELDEIRGEIRKLTASVSRKLQAVLKKSQAEGIVEAGAVLSVRNGRAVIPLNVYDKNRISGLIHDQSASGKTVYIEPAEVVAMNNQLVELENSELREMVKILTRFADSVRPYIGDLLTNYDIIGEIDFIRARALLGN
ncbi:MAG: endonuclease MutS2, partial [Bacteroidia bacterium]